MFYSLWSNGPKEVLEYVDYRFDQHFGTSISSYPPRAVLYDYITGRATAGNIRKFIRFRTAVRHVDFDETTQEFRVTVEDLLSHRVIENLIFDHVIVATGHFSIPNMPEFEGLTQFPGRVLHSHDYRGADEFVGQNLLIIGGSYSAEDIAMQCYKYGARSITISYRTAAMDFKWPETVKEVPLVERIQGHTAYFKDGTHLDNIDSIILCTGYRHNHLYMAEKLRLYCPSNVVIPPNLYKGIFWAAEPRLAYLGMQDQLYTLNMFDIQAALVRDVFLGIVTLPDDGSEQKRHEDITQWQARGATLVPGDHEGFSDLQTDYLRDLIECCDQTTVPKFDLERSSAGMYKFFRDKNESIVNYRNQPFPSIFPPYELAPVSQTPWLESMDDSISGYIGSIKKS
jgi:trimethylamine monooxygenase